MFYVSIWLIFMLRFVCQESTGCFFSDVFCYTGAAVEQLDAAEAEWAKHNSFRQVNCCAFIHISYRFASHPAPYLLFLIGMVFYTIL